MKGKSLFKKLGAMATTVAMLASVGVTSFAAETNTGVKAGSISVAETGTDTGIYKVTVPYTVDDGVTSTIGVTMLAYGAGTSGSTMTDTTVYVDTMEIVGVDQNNAGSGATSFEFYVDTTENNEGEAAANAIEVEKGEKIVVLLSCDGAAGANGYLVQVGKPDGTAAINGSASATVNSDYPTDAADAIADVKTMLAAGVLTLEGSNVTDTAKIGVEAVGTAYDPAKWQEQTVTYKVTVTSDEYEVNYGTDEYLTYTVTYAADPWDATGVTVADLTLAKETVVAAGNDVAAAAKAAITSVELTDGTNTKTVAVTADQLTVTNAAPAFDAAANNDVDYTVDVKLATGQYDRFTVGTDGLSDTGVKVTVTAVDTRVEITSVTFGAATTLTIENADAPADLEELLADVKAHVEAGGVKVNGTADYPAVSLTYETSDTYTKPEGSDAATVTYTVTAPTGVTIAGYKWAEGAQAATLTVTVTVKGVAPALRYMLGDVVADDDINMQDWMAILNHTTEAIVMSDLNDSSTEAFKRANVAGGDEEINMQDWMAILNHTTEAIVSDTIGTYVEE